MFNNAVVDVVIGLVLIYLLYSLFLTIIIEFVVARIGLRERILRQAIERMLNDSYYEKAAFLKRISWRWLQRFFLYEPEEFKTSLAGRFYSHPTIKYLSKADKRSFITLKNSKPAYMSSEQFADAMIRMLREKGSGATDLEKIIYTLTYNTIHAQPETLKLINHIFHDAGKDIINLKVNLKKWFDEMMDRTTGWYKRKVRMLLFILGFMVAGAFNVDTLSITHILSTNEKARNQLVTMATELAKDSLRYVGYVKIGNDSVPAKALIDTSISRILYDVNRANVILGLGWDFSHLVRKDEWKIKDPQKIESILANKVILDSLQKTSGSLKRNIDSLNMLMDSLSVRLLSAKWDSTRNLLNQEARDAGITTAGVSNLIESPSAISRQIVLRKRIRQLDSAEFKLLSDSIAHYSNIRNQLTGINLVTVTQMSVERNEKGAVLKITASRSLNWIEKVLHILGNIFGFNRQMLGLLITALAICLGAPFWFDLLKKLVSIRSAGVKPEEKPLQQESNVPAQTTSPVTSAGLKDAPAGVAPLKSELAMKQLSAMLKDEPGIVGIALEFKDADSQPILVVMISSLQVRHYLLRKYGDRYTFNETVYKILYQIEVPNAVNIGGTGEGIRNSSRQLGAGTLGCFLKKQGSEQLYMLSCWHVMKDNPEWRASIVQTKIIDAQSKTPIGTVEQGCLSNCIDVGIAVVDSKAFTPSNAAHPIKAQHRKVTAFDALVKTPVTLIGRVAGTKNARIFHHKIDAAIKYADGNTYLIEDVFSISVLDANEDPLRSPTSPGDSGAVVIDNKNIPVGMIIGGNNRFSYAVKFSNMFDRNKPFQEFSFLI